MGENVFTFAPANEKKRCTLKQRLSLERKTNLRRKRNKILTQTKQKKFGG